MARATQAQKDAYISKLEEQLRNEEDYLKIMSLKPSKKIAKTNQNKAQSWLIVSLVIVLILMLMNVFILVMYMDLVRLIGA